MRLSELRTGESGVIVKVHGHGGFSKRIVEMGFVKGTLVESLLNAPSGDPVKYRVMDYELSLRRAEAELVEIVSKDEVGEGIQHQIMTESLSLPSESHLHAMRSLAEEKSRHIHVVFVGNPNCGKTSIFNIAGKAHERVGNYSGVTVDAKDASIDFGGYHFSITDLPGTYSLSTYTPEELYVRKYIIEQTPDVIINVVDACNLERNLYLTSQLIDMDVPMVMALNMYDELKESGCRLDVRQLELLLGTPIIPTIGRTGLGIHGLLQEVINVYEGKQHVFRHIHVNHGKELENAIQAIEYPIRKNPEPHHNYSGRFLAIKLLENDHQIGSIVQQMPNHEEIFQIVKEQQDMVVETLDQNSESAIIDAKYAFVCGALKECLVRPSSRLHSRIITKRIDAIVTHRWLSFIIFFAVIYLTFFCTFTLGAYPMEWIEDAVALLKNLLLAWLPHGWLRDLALDGIIEGVGGVIVFLPNILILYAFISWMEDSGYMARVAFIMDKVMHLMGLHGKSFIPMIMGFGCGIPAIMATRTIEDRKLRLITMLILPLMSCSARLPVYIIIITAFFPHNQTLLLFSLYLLGIVMSVLMAHFFSKYVVKGETSPFVMELPPYRLPSLKIVWRHTSEKGYQYLRKMGTTILAASVIIWVLSYFPRSENLSSSNHLQQSYIGQIGETLEPVVRLCGFGWKEGVSIITGIGAKEIVASTMSILYGFDDEDSQSMDSPQISLTPAAALAFMVFVLLYMPCIPSCIAIKHESGHWKWPLFTIFYTTILAWIMATIIYQGSILLNI